MQARINGAELNYDAAGSGTAVLFLHAFPLGLGMWDAQAAALRERFTVVRFDARGFGGSPAGDSLLTMERIAEDGVALLDHLGISKAIVCGSSMGGYAAFAMVRRFADRLAGLVLAGTRAVPDTPEARKARGELAARVRSAGQQAIVDAFLSKLIGKSTASSRPEVAERLRAMMLAASVPGICNALAGLAARADSRDTLRQITVPALILCGEEDETTPPADSRAMHEGIRGSRLVMVPRAGHICNVEAPAEFNAALLEFAASVPRPASA